MAVGCGAAAAAERAVQTPACAGQPALVYSVILDMPKKKPYARIAITLPQDVLAAADRLAKELDRSRSWVIAEAVRRYAARSGAVSAPDRVREAQSAPYGPVSGLGESRLAQLRADLELTPEERVKAAEDTARTTDRPLRGGPAGRLILFDRYEDYLEWKKRDAIGLG